MGYKLTACEWAAISPMLPNKTQCVKSHFSPGRPAVENFRLGSFSMDPAGFGCRSTSAWPQKRT